MKKTTRFLWWCAGARPDILENCPTDHAKYFGIGGTILFTALMASFAGGYAFFTAFQNSFLAILFGVFWGLLIFNLDRYIVATIGKGDGTSKITKEEWLSAAPRLIMAVLLGFVIATPLELKIFEPEIKTIVERLKIDKGEELKSRDVSFNLDINDSKKRLSEIESNIKHLTENKAKFLKDGIKLIEERKAELVSDSKQKRTELIGAQNKLNSAQANYLIAYNDISGKYSKAQINSKQIARNNAKSIRDKISNEKKEIDDRITVIETDKEIAIKNEAAKIEKQIALSITEKESLINKITDLDKTKARKTVGYEDKVKNYDGFAAHLEAMSILTEEKSSIFWSKWLITFLFIFIEIAPVLFKLMTDSGPYDDIIDRIKHEVYVAERQKMSDLNDAINTNILISTEKNKGRLDAELKGNKELLEAIAISQAEIAKKAVEKWKENELKRLEKSTSHMIQSNTKTNGLTFEDKFWLYKNSNDEFTYVFKNGSSNELWLKGNNKFSAGKWFKINNSQIEVEINNDKKLYNIEELTDTTLRLCESGTSNKLELLSI
jgi:hypothetical protein